MPELSIRNTEMEHIVQQISHYDKIVFGAINKYWARAVKSIQAKEFFAELLGTFILVVSEINMQADYVYRTNLHAPITMIGLLSLYIVDR